MKPRIAVVGAGPGGLTCARILQVNGVDVTVLEQEQAPDARAQGGSLDLHADSGQVALKAAGLYDRFTALARPEGQESRLRDHVTADLIRQDIPDDNFKPEIDRGQLRALLLDSLTAGTVQWGRDVRTVEPTGEIQFADNTKTSYDLVIGADGAWSRVRAAISPAVPEYTGITFVETGFDERDHPELAELVGNGLMLAKHDGRAIFGQRNSGGHIRVYLALRVHASAVDVDKLLEAYDGWHESLRDFVRHNDTGFTIRPIHALPVPHTWAHNPKITLLGDAAHLMPPLGVGANLAMLDGAELAQAVVNGGKDPVQAYESVLLPRSAEIAREVVDGLKTLI